MMIKKILLILLLTSNILHLKSQNNTCANASPFCTGQTMQFPAGTSNTPAQTGPNYGCLGSQPNPAWFYFQMATNGPVSIVMSAPQDIDFIAWGPFPTLGGNCGNLTAGNTQDCSYSGTATETCVIANAVAGQFYLLMITNFSNANQLITFSQNNANAPGAGQTNCGVLCSMTVTATNSLCAGGTATMSAITGSQVVSVAWSGPGGFSATGNTAGAPNITSTGVYTALATTTGTNPATNTCSITRTITVLPSPTLTVGNNGPVCVGSQANLTAAGATTYMWGGPNGFISNIANPVVANAQVASAGVYTVVGTSSSCTSAATTTLVINPNPTVTASNSGAYCVGQSFSLAATGANTYAWAGPNGFTSNTANPSFANNLLTYSGTYSVLGTTNGCTATANTNVTINALPNITASSSGNVCANSGFTLSASGGTAYAWTGPAGFNSFASTIGVPSGQVSMTGTYNITGTDANGCINTATLAQVVYPQPIPSATGSSKCLNETLVLLGAGGSSYQWSGPAGFTSNQQNAVVNGAQFNNAGVYTVTVSNAGGCAATATANAVVFSNPVIGYTGVTEICKGGVFSFAGTGGLNYKWLTMFGELSQANTFSVSSVSPQLQTTYTLVGADGNGCYSNVVIAPVVLALPYATIAPETTGKCIPFTTKFKMTNQSANITNINWNFSNGGGLTDSTQTTYNVTTAGIHTINVSLTDNKGCKGGASSTVEGYPVPRADFSFTPEAPTQNNNVVAFNNQTTEAKTVSWYWDFFSNDQNISSLENPSFSFPEVGNYFIFFKVISNHGCRDSIIKKLTVGEDVTFFIPNSFTPNGDGLNEIFLPKSVGIKKFKMEIFDRWGQMIFATSDFFAGWDGRHHKGGEMVPQDVYIYKITASFNDGGKAKQFVGKVTLLK
ncbi:MAG: gliding motility-associated C-terminal domain-containing protein [Bacteroidetes bacterium]|nr:gliding motility-associated C-terminal domain-containing protein [Bacteroidota bacterium]